MNSIWNSNITAFSKRFPQLADLYRQQISYISEHLSACDFITSFNKIFDFWKIEPAKNGQWTACENGAYLHSKYNPGNGHFSTDSSDFCKENVFVVLGGGIGYEVVKLCSENKESGVIYLEPCPERFFAALCLLDWTSIFKTEKLVIALSCPLDQLIPLCENFSSSGNVKIKYFLNPAFAKHAEDYFISAKRILDRNITKTQINENTLKKFGKLWERNARLNLPQVEKLRGVNELKNCAKGKSFLVIAAGPSLSSILPYLEKLHKNLIFVCVDTALRAVLKAGVEPDYIILTDPQFWAYKHIAGLKSPSSVLIADAVSYPAVFRFLCKEILVTSSPFPISEKYKKIFERKGELSSGGSVATVAWSFCQHCGAQKIFTCGLDLSFPSRETHIKGSTFEQAIHTVSTKLSSAEKSTSAVLFGADVSPAVNYEGNTVLTDSRMKMFAWWFESRIASFPEVKTYSLCSQSMKIPGIDFFKDLESLCH